MNQNKTKPTTTPVDSFLATISDARRAEAKVLIAMLQRISGEPAVMWGPSIIGFGLQRYKTKAGREGEMGMLGFSPRKSALTIYFYEGFGPYKDELSQLGKHTVSLSCLYIKKLSDSNMAILEKMLTTSYRAARESQLANS